MLPGYLGGGATERPLSCGYTLELLCWRYSVPDRLRRDLGDLIRFA